MKVADLQVQTGAPQRALLDSRFDIEPAALLLLGAAQRTVRCMHRDLTPFGLDSTRLCARIEQFLLAHPQARLRLLADDTQWFETQAARLKLLHRRFSHAIEVRRANMDDPVGADGCLLADAEHLLLLEPRAETLGDVWLHNAPRASTWVQTFDRRWDAAAHNLPVAPLGL